jgi:hypothetical protein
LFKNIANCILIFCLFFVQAAEAFTASHMPCAQEHVMVSELENTEQANVSEQHLVMQSMQMDNSEADCCQQECCCGSGLITHAVLIDVSTKPDVNIKTPQPTAIDKALNTLVLSKLQRPPKAPLLN